MKFRTLILSLLLLSTFCVTSEEYIHQYNGGFEQPSLPSQFWSQLDREGGTGYNGILRRTADHIAGNYGMRFKFGGMGCPTATWNDCARVELWARGMQPIADNSYRWYAYSFKIDEIHDKDLFQSGLPVIINQFHYETAEFASNGPKIQFYVKQDDHDGNPNTLNLRMQVTQECGYSNAALFTSSTHGEMCTNRLGTIRKLGSTVQSIEVGKWYHVRVEVGAGHPTSTVTEANGRVAAAIKENGGNWSVFRFNGWTYLDIFSHESDESRNWKRINHNLKFGIYQGGLRTNDQGYEASIVFDEIYGEHYFSALPALYKY